jgi:hypothetical protein
MKALIRILIFLCVLCILQAGSFAAVIDQVVAFVDDQAITMSELEEQYAKAVKITPDITRREVLDTMVNRFVLLREAKRLRMEAPDDEKLLEEYIDIKVAAFIKVSDDDIKKFYEANRDEFGGQELAALRDKIEQYLREREVNEKLKKHIEELKKKAYIKVLLDQP